MMRFSILLFFVLATTLGHVPQQPDPPNILWIFGEDIGRELAVYGTPEVHTPNFDALAARGMLFANAFTTSPVCSPSRSAYHTGMYQMAIGAHNHRSHRPGDGSVYPFPLPRGVRVVTDWLRDAGYFTANIRQFPDDVPFTGSGKTDWNFTYAGEPFDTDQWSDLKDHQPFFAEVNFPETHRGRAWDTAKERIPKAADPDKVVIPPYYPDIPVVREDWAQYLNAVMSLDYKVGVVLEQLERDGLADNTIVIFMGDHGRAMIRGKQFPYDSGLHVPMIIAWPSGVPAPAGFEAGTTYRQIVSSIDVTATTLDIAGAPKPANMHGRILFGPNAELPRRYAFSGRDRGDETIDRMRTVRSARFRYIRNYFPEKPLMQQNGYKQGSYPAYWPIVKMYQEGKLNEVQARMWAPTRPVDELYDIIQDPYETVNLADSPAHQEILQDLQDALDGWIEAIDDQGRFAEPKAVYDYYHARMERNYRERITAIQERVGITPEEN